MKHNYPIGCFITDDPSFRYFSCDSNHDPTSYLAIRNIHRAEAAKRIAQKQAKNSDHPVTRVWRCKEDKSE